MKYERQDQLIKILLKYFKGIAPLAIYDMVETLWPGRNTDEKVKFDIGDPAAGYLWDKLVEGPGIILEEGEGTDANKVVISAPGGGTPVNVVAGDGMDFPTNDPVTLGTPSTVDKTTTNSVTTHSHTHELGHVYDWKLQSPDQVVGDLDEPENIVPSIDGVGASDTLIPSGTFVIVAINSEGETLPVAVPEMDILVDTTSVVVSWDAVPGATAYKVYEVSTELYYDLISNVWLYLTQTPATAGTLPTTNTALVYQSEFTIDDADIVKIIGEGCEIETYAEPGDSTIKVIKIIVTGGGGSDIISGLGMDFETNDPVDLGLPSTIDSTTENALTEHSHTHKIGNIDVSNIIKGGIKYGALYNWYSATDARNITSSDDWVIPDLTQMTSFILTHLPDFYDGYKLMDDDLSYWPTVPPNDTAFLLADNIYGFSARGSSNRNQLGVFAGFPGNFLMWLSTSVDSGNSKGFGLIPESSTHQITRGNSTYSNKQGLAIRLLYTGAGTPTSYTGNDGTVYPVILIGTEYWLACNLNERKYRTGDWIHGYDGGVYNPIADATWGALTTEAMCYYNDYEVNGVEETPISTLFHPPVTIHPDSAAFASIGANQVLTINDQTGGSLPKQVPGLTLSSAGWTLVSGLYEYDLANANITATSIVEVIPANADIATVKAAEILPETDSSTGSVKLYSTNAPTADIGVTINIFEATT